MDFNMLEVTVFIVSTLVLNTHGQKNKENDNNIKWTIKSSPIVFGQDAVLFCNLSRTDHCCTNTVTWMKESDVILHHGASTNSSKYQQFTEKGGFSLLIKHFDEKDVNCQYTCLYGFDTYSSILRINSNDFELRPVNKTTKYKMNATQLVVDLKFGKVFPSPQCQIMMNDRILQSKRVENETTNGLFLASHIKLICELQSENCSGNISVQCMVGNTHVMKTTILSDCKNVDAAFTAIGNTVMEVVLGISLFFGCFLIAVTAIIIKKKLHLRPKYCVDLEDDEMHSLLPVHMWSECLCLLEIISECFNNRRCIPLQRRKDVIKVLQDVFCDSLNLQLEATNLRINQIRNSTIVGLDSLLPIASMYNRTYIDVLQKMTTNRIETADKDSLWNVSYTAIKDPSLKFKEKSNGGSCYVGKRLLAKKERDIILRITYFALIRDEQNMLVTASNNRINLARHLLWKEKNRLDAMYRNVRLGMSEQQSPRNDGPPISRFNRIQHDMDLIIAIATFKKTNSGHCLLMAVNIQINKARIKTS